MNRLLLIATVITGAIALAGLALLATGGLSGSATPGTPVRSTGTALIGGPFTLVDHTGRTVTEADFRGRHMLIYFGFTHCPDVCPTALQIMSVALDQLAETKGAEAAAQVVPVFITVDPERDDVAAMAAYVGHFGDRFVGLTGTPAQIEAATGAFKVYARKVEDPNSAGGYTMDHSSVVYLMGPDGAFLANFTHETDPARMARKIASFL